MAENDQSLTNCMSVCIYSNESARVSEEHFLRATDKGVEKDGREGTDNKPIQRTCGTGGSKSGKGRAGNESTSILGLQGKLDSKRLGRLKWTCP